ncbi:MAG: phenylalanine--tRNA ligase subunit alpha [Caldibacillus debilis]|jgi:phenylalanyl-tRNA synthetase alpha chain|uniref:Phenylalanine--tRNA ligase alpha subunit n=1 Tax=Caldibacillus debilis TaxID=301148 RepID=A0A3E0JX67_9BACI|nr:phenylalanine--tRNA ligase subunit alpha [Caldibacillus debilis]MBO2481967.1 phenylalanine--tRNA ligase subunit alpha [Bacillaceae bacterium]MBY6271002.1 phenylalanine--tRNA ligase subunit alpha [Bacillaceae bacterium]OUM90948.1 MAG: phenylalanine--tRNA ligase subunit alpha [Caldibacillus debilis]REJ13341.1 MAG: phenylalanine--tRNA ligase subunit alpha [Caldibacillus debilis]REJ24427.1 MAG: phenylalanine--tRNA ligase subunit alpha [Caldibacillus debilis]
MKERLTELQAEALEKVKAAKDLRALNDVRVAFLGKKGRITEVLRNMGKLPKEERPVVGAYANEVRETIQRAIEEKMNQLEKEQMERELAEETVDVTLPGRPVRQAGRHPLIQIIEEIEDLFIGMGYRIAEGPEVETDYYNFEALNLPKGHPARDMQDSFYISEEILLRTHTSPVQARTMESHQGRGPVKIICPGKVYRRDNDDATHSHQFMQVEGLVVDENIRMSDLKGTLEVFAKKIFGDDREIRLRPSFFPFTEPSVEMDISCKICRGQGCPVCKGTGWIEILGAGMVHPNVLKMGGFDPDIYSGFAFGIGVERIAMLKYGIDDIRHFYTNDVRFLQQFYRQE